MKEITETLHELEQELEGLVRDFRRIGEILKTIRNERLYRDAYSSFDDYCKKRWNFTRQRAHQFIEAYDVDREVGGVLENEFQARSLLRLKDPDIRQQVVRRAREQTEEDGRNVFAKALNCAANAVLEKIESKAARQKFLVRKIQELFLELDDDSRAAFLFWASRKHSTGSMRMRNAGVIETRTVDDGAGGGAPAGTHSAEEDRRQYNFDSDTEIATGEIMPVREEVDDANA
jgi:hypothetical protein